MRTHHAIALLAAAGCLGLTGCDPQAAGSGTSTSPVPGSPSATTAATLAPATGAPLPPKAGKPAAAVATVPDFVGRVLQDAQDGAQAAGFYVLSSHDSLGKNRNQVLDRNWKVCTQTPAPGAATSTDTKIDFGTVKNEESCP
ncbi:PASTA domain-containing protein [Streptomyces sp. NPDC048257]|uniref:PASTA domain-containing protein n=1 Tax=Streptomyces sp. NPDC048257 TaxID=3365526 RepID=UPI00371F208E